MIQLQDYSPDHIVTSRGRDAAQWLAKVTHWAHDVVATLNQLITLIQFVDSMSQQRRVPSGYSGGTRCFVHIFRESHFFSPTPFMPFAEHVSR